MFYKILIVGLGGSLGSILRFVCVRTIDTKFNSSFPYGTLTVNIVGSFVIGVVYASVTRKTGGSEYWSLFLGAGLCGGFTTFSAFALENISLINQKMLGTSLLYIVLSLSIGLLATGAGILVGNRL